MNAQEARQRIGRTDLYHYRIEEHRAARVVLGTIERAGFDPDGTFVIRWHHDECHTAYRTTAFLPGSWEYELMDGDRTLRLTRLNEVRQGFDDPWPTANLYVVSLPTT